MSRADYAHWNEDADYMWWQEEGRHGSEEPDPDLAWERQRDREADAEDAFSEELVEMAADDLLRLICDADYATRWPKARKLIQWEINDRGLVV